MPTRPLPYKCEWCGEKTTAPCHVQVSELNSRKFFGFCSEACFQAFGYFEPTPGISDQNTWESHHIQADEIEDAIYDALVRDGFCDYAVRALEDQEDD